jgi:hypothetical protein
MFMRTAGKRHGWNIGKGARPFLEFFQSYPWTKPAYRGWHPGWFGLKMATYSSLILPSRGGLTFPFPGCWGSLWSVLTNRMTWKWCIILRLGLKIYISTVHSLLAGFPGSPAAVLLECRQFTSLTPHPQVIWGIRLNALDLAEPTGDPSPSGPDRAQSIHRVLKDSTLGWLCWVTKFEGSQHNPR